MYPALSNKNWVIFACAPQRLIMRMRCYLHLIRCIGQQLMWIECDTFYAPWYTPAGVITPPPSSSSSSSLDNARRNNSSPTNTPNGYRVQRIIVDGWTELSAISSTYTKPGISWPVVRYAPIPAMMPIMASLPLSFSATIFSFSISFIRKYLELLVL